MSCMVVAESAFVPFRILMKELDELRAASSYLAHQEQGKNQYFFINNYILDDIL